MKKSKLKIEKFRILELTNPSNIRGGTGGDSDTNLTTDTMGSDNTTYTTDPDVQCPLTIGSDGQPLTRTTVSGNSVPTFNITINPEP